MKERPTTQPSVCGARDGRSPRARAERGRLKPIRLLVVLTVAAGTSASMLAASSAATDRPRASALRVVPRPTPSLRVPHYRTRGTDPQASRRGLDLRLV